MEITKNQLKGFKKIYKEQFLEEIDDETARDVAGRLTNLVDIVLSKV